MTDIFNQIKIADDLEEAVKLNLNRWFPVYLRELEIQAGIAPNSLMDPQAYLTSSKIDKEAGDQLPAIVCVSPGLSGTKPRQEGDGSISAFFSIGIGVFVGAGTRSDTNRLVRIYTAIVRTIMIQKRSLGGYANGTIWLDESYDDEFSFTDNQTVAAGQVVFEVEVAGVVNRYGGPASYGQPEPAPNPVTQPGSNWPLADVVTATVGIEE